MITKKKELALVIRNWQEEKGSALLFRSVAECETDLKRKKIFLRVAQVEEEHAEVWEEELRRNDIPCHYRRSFKITFLLFLIRWFGSTALIDVLERTKRAKIRRYFNQIEVFSSEDIQNDVKKLFSIEKEHATMLNCLGGKAISPFDDGEWHKEGGSIRDIIFGMNDGLLSTFSLIAGVAGSNATQSVVLLAGLAGAVAGAISMAAGAFVSTKAEREVMEQQLAIEKKELEIMPEGEEKELTLLYQNKGIPQEQAQQIAEIIMSNKDVALETMAREELGFSPQEMVNPHRAALFCGVSFVIGSAVPLAPCFLMRGECAFILAIVFSLSSFFIIGACRTVVTGKSAFRSGAEMFMIGLVAALITYIIGNFIGTIV